MSAEESDDGMGSLVDAIDRSALPDTWGVEKLACANFRTFDDVVDKIAAKRGVHRADLREALAHWLDHDRAVAREQYDIPTAVLDEAANACTDVVLRDPEYKFLIDRENNNDDG